MFYTSEIPFFSIYLKKRKSHNYWQKIDSGGCFTHLLGTFCQFLCNYLLRYKLNPIILWKLNFHSKDIFWRYFSKNLLDPFVTNSKFVCWPAWGCGWQSSWSGEHLSNLLALLAVVTSRESAVFVKFSQYSISPKTQR